MKRSVFVLGLAIALGAAAGCIGGLVAVVSIACGASVPVSMALLSIASLGAGMIMGSPTVSAMFDRLAGRGGS